MSTSAPQALPPGRYGAPPSLIRRRLGRAAAGLLVVLGLVWVGWAGLDRTGTEVHWEPVGYVLHDDTSVTVTYDLAKNPRDTAVCSLRALDRNKTAVGIAEVTIGPASDPVIRRSDTFRTSAQAVTGIVRSCRLSGAPQR